MPTCGDCEHCAPMDKPDARARADAICDVPLPRWIQPPMLRRALYFITMDDDADGCDPFTPKDPGASTTDDGGARYLRITKAVTAAEADRADEETARQESAGPTT